MELHYKEINQCLAVKDADEKLGIVTGYLSQFGNSVSDKDSDGDVIQKGAYTKTIQESGPDSKKARIKFLLDHDKTKCVGVFQVLKEDNFGLYYEAKTGTHNVGLDFMKMCADGIITEHSVGFQKLKEKLMDGYNAISEIKLWEGSGLQCWGANQNTPLTGVKSQEQLSELFKKLDKALHFGTYTDEAMIEFQKQYDEISSYFSKNEKQEPVLQDSQKSFRERIELKGMNWMAYEMLTDRQKDAISEFDNIEYRIKDVMSRCGVAMATPEAKSTALTIIESCITQCDILKSAENTILGITSGEKSEKLNQENTTEPLNDTQTDSKDVTSSFLKNLNESLKAK
jgi:uncharacterized protein